MLDFKDRAFPMMEVSEKEWNDFASKFEYFEVSRGEKLVKKGEVEKYLTFIDVGIIRSFLVSNNKDRTLRFTFPGNFVSAYTSFILQVPSVIELEALSDCKCWRISYKDIQESYASSMEGNSIGRRSAEFLYILSSQREINMLTKSPEERYLELLNKNQEWFQHIPLKHVASYLGITPQALSRIRGRIF